MSFNRERDALSLQKERRETSSPSDVSWENVEEMPLAGKSMNQWLSELDSIAKEVEAELVTRDIGCHLVEVLEAVNMVLFESRGFKRSPILLDSNCAYLHTVLNSGSCSAILLSVIYIEVCRRLNLTIVGSRVGEDFLIWPPAGNPEELFRVTSGLSLFGVVNGKCVDDPRSKASDITSNSLEALEIATNRDIIGIALANLIRFYWKRASRSNHGLMLTSPLRPANFTDERITIDCTNLPLLRPQDLRLAMMASERLLILQPHNWALRRDYGMMLYYSREYEQAVQELSICMVFAPEEEEAVLEPFVEKLHLLRLESSWKSLGNKGRLTIS
ncbi:OLC1v1030894C1 [Oldenlandia corymbosa var. corymbosa]|nr:OLC1v1030894C1 [Oldenlandia corymbosa var. corymbosa]